MPVIPSSAYNVASQIFSLVRAHLNDQKSNVFTNNILTPYVQAAYRKMQRELANSGQETFITDEALLVVAALAAPDPSVQVAITDATAPPNQLPVDLVCPLRVWERPDGTTQEFADLSDWTGRGGMPSYPQDQTLHMWEWRSDGLYFPGALQDVQIRLRYLKMLPEISDGTSQISIRSVIDAVAFFAAYYAANARGAKMAATLLTLAEDALFDMQNTAARRDQRKGRRRRRYGSRNTLWI